MQLFSRRGHLIFLSAIACCISAIWPVGDDFIVVLIYNARHNIKPVSTVARRLAWIALSTAG
jgi:hypothetical protein